VPTNFLQLAGLIY